MALIRVAYKIVVDPSTFEYIIVELQQHEQEGTDVRRIEKRLIEKEELSEWTKAEFMEKMEEGGYGFAAKSYLERNAITFSCGQQP